ncbi:MAG: menaquinone biosynthesis protein, partial [Bacteroidota bacterium]
MEKYRLCAVSYLNTKPFLYGLLQHPIAEQLDMETAIPSECARKLLNGEVDIALVPVAILPELPNYQLLGDYCIGTVGAVKTVCIYGDVPIEKMDAIYLDFHSRTSAMLTRLLLEEYWQHSPQLLPTQEGYIDNIGGTTGGLIIGDRTIGLEKQFQYIYDLGDIWEKYTGLPFVFAAWVSRRPLP